jgi:hypothetical protein
MCVVIADAISTVVDGKGVWCVERTKKSGRNEQERRSHLGRKEGEAAAEEGAKRGGGEVMWRPNVKMVDVK